MILVKSTPLVTFTVNNIESEASQNARTLFQYVFNHLRDNDFNLSNLSNILVDLENFEDLFKDTSKEVGLKKRGILRVYKSGETSYTKEVYFHSLETFRDINLLIEVERDQVHIHLLEKL